MIPDCPRIALTPGEPAGIGPDLCVLLAQQSHAAELVAVCDPEILRERAEQLGLPLAVAPVDFRRATKPQAAGTLLVHTAATLAVPACAGRLEAANARYVVDTLTAACDGCLDGRYAAMVTGPVHKGIINDTGLRFSGHTELLAERCGAEPVMLLVTTGLRVALATTHLPLAEVPAALTQDLMRRVLHTLAAGLRERFGLARPRILVCGLNPHAGEGGHLGHEENEIIVPVLAELRDEGVSLVGPLPADTAFIPRQLAGADAVLAMYHDQGLPVLKHRGFGHAVNVTLGLPIIRTSVDHGTALDLAGTGQAEVGSLTAAVDLALRMVRHGRRGSSVGAGLPTLS